ncbi:conserved hypothetical protein [Candidatus Competibacter denitrificans Run_A_D11]|uniref:Uncharacterized protein n=1 Tax=Candidatus Competibacter denitrificans Run_A_D11 TaxID=1400863 RepID=W6ME64_9GAMM|nr:phage protein Gp27 family protein [Candidatus Competibacter denitrificans]CDI04068.1 conserved hypothetical protein [Candidatus Competibacter denitrificans Run_A_D11]HRC70878.1 DUF3486 family protein [Candidatus Competibacter denitrificans]
MAPPRKVDLLPPEIRKGLDDRLIASGFGDYNGLSDWLGALGYEISKSALHQYGQEYKQEFNDTLRRLTVATYMAKQINDEMENALDKTNSVRLRDKVFEEITALEKAKEATDPITRAKHLNSLTLSQSRLSRASINRQKWDAELSAKTQAAAEAIEKIAKRGGLNADTAAEIRREILGIAA